MNKFIFSLFKDISNGKECIRLFGLDPDHIYPAKVINTYIGKDILSIGGKFLIGIHLILHEKDFLIWSEKIAKITRFWDQNYNYKKDRKLCLLLDEIRNGD